MSSSIRTRSSARRSQEEGELKELQEVQPLLQRPPRPPPPPPPRRPSNSVKPGTAIVRGQESHDGHGEIAPDRTRSAPVPVGPFASRIRGGAEIQQEIPPLPPPPESIVPEHEGNPESIEVVADWILHVQWPTEPTLVKIHIHSEMSSVLLGNCLMQLALDHSYEHSEPIVGLFRQQDGVFFSFEHILTSQEARHSAYMITLPRRLPIVAVPWWRSNAFLFVLSLIVLMTGWYYSLVIFETSWNFFSESYVFIFDLPLRELYRYGPHIIGWEGADLSEICSRITYHGDKSFWSRNLMECDSIYAAKEEAFLRVTRPAMYAMLALILFYALRHLVSKYAESRRDIADRDMIETYRAFQIILRQAHRGSGGDRHHKRS
jgi:hypothetical protein